MSTVLGVNAVFHDPAAALVIDGEIVAAAEEERFNRRKHGKEAVPFSTWELPLQAARWCLDHAGIGPEALDVVAYSYDPTRAEAAEGLTADGWEPLRTLYARRAPQFLATALPGLDHTAVRHVPHHVAHAASAALAAPFGDGDVIVCDGRGEATSQLLGTVRDQRLEVLHEQPLPHSLGLLYEAVTEHLGFRRSSDEYKVMALASYGRPSFAAAFEQAVRFDGQGGFRTDPMDLGALVPPRGSAAPYGPAHADLARSLQQRLEEVLLEVATWLQACTGNTCLSMAGGVALNCVANSRLWREGPYDQLWVQPAAGDAGTALGAALWAAAEQGDRVRPMRTAALGPAWAPTELEAELRRAGIPVDRPDDLSGEVAAELANDRVVAWYSGRSEFGPRALGHRSLLADPRPAGNVERLNEIKGREDFRPVAPIVRGERAGELFDGGPLPSPYMLFVHQVRDAWRDRIPAVVHVDGTARVQTVDPAEEPEVAELLDRFERLTGVPVLVNTSFNTAGRPMVDSPRDALECFGSSPIDVLVLGPFVVRRASLFAAS